MEKNSYRKNGNPKLKSFKGLLERLTGQETFAQYKKIILALTND